MSNFKTCKSMNYSTILHKGPAFPLGISNYNQFWSITLKINWFSAAATTAAVKDIGCNGGYRGRNIKITCPVCTVAVVRRGFRRHYETMHCAQDPVSCQFCQKSFKHRYSLDCHQRQSHPHEKKETKQQALIRVKRVI